MPVDFQSWLDESVDRVREKGLVRGTAGSAYWAYVGAWLTLSSRLPLGTNVFERDWDALILLDACRVDAMEAVADEYDFLGPVDVITSVGSTSYEWMMKTFTRRYAAEISDAAYVCGNPYLRRTFHDRDHPPNGDSVPLGPTAYDVVAPEDFAYLDDVTGYGIDKDLGIVTPRTMTDRAVRTGRTADADRLVVHYMQPHEPYFTADRSHVENTRQRFQAGEATREEAFRRYLDTLQTVLDDVEILLANLDAETVVISADHGELFGEWGVSGHPIGLPHPALKRVPWVETTATDAGTYEPTIESPTETVDDERLDEHLKHLGYK